MPTSYAARIALVTTHISEHMTEPLPLEALARVAGFSPYHFHRLFKAGTGETVNEFVTRRRLERAAGLMRASRTLPLTRVAADCGFSELADFSRCFKQQFGLAPSRWDRTTPLQHSKIRQAPIGLPAYTDAELAALASDPRFRVTITEVPAQTLAFIRVIDAYSKPDAVMAAYDALLAWADARGPRGTLIGMSEDDPEITPPALYRYDACITVPARTKPDETVAVRTLPAHTQARLHCDGDIALIDQALQYLYRHWLPASDWLPGNLPAMEVYRRTPDAIGWEHFDLDCAIAIERS